MSPVPGSNFSESCIGESMNPVLDKLNIFSNLLIDSLNFFFRKDTSKLLKLFLQSQLHQDLKIYLSKFLTSPISFDNREEPSVPNLFSKKVIILSLSVIIWPLNSIAGNLPEPTFLRYHFSFWP